MLLFLFLLGRLVRFWDDQSRNGGFLARWRDVSANFVTFFKPLHPSLIRLVSGLFPRGTKSLIEEAQEQARSNGLLVKLHAKLVTVLWIIMGLDMKSVKPLTLFDTTVMLSSCLVLGLGKGFD